MLRAPHALYDGMRAAGVVNMGDGGVIVSRRADVDAVLGDPTVFSSGMGTTETGASRPLIPLQIDPPQHRDYRKLLDPLFTLQRMREMEASVTELVRRLVDGIAHEREVDFVERFSIPFPSQVFLSLLGLPMEHLPRFLEMKDGFIRPESITGQPARASRLGRAHAPHGRLDLRVLRGRDRRTGGAAGRRPREPPAAVRGRRRPPHP